MNLGLHVANLSSYAVTHTTTLEALQFPFVLALDSAESYLFVGALRLVKVSILVDVRRTQFLMQC